MARRWVGTVLLLAGCATVAQATRAPVAAVGRLLLSEDEEKRLGDELAAEVRQRERMVDDAAVQEWIAKVQDRIAAAVPEEDRKFPFQTQVVDDPETVNAFALPGGHLFVYSGLILQAENEAEVAAVLAHEVAHVALDHPAQQLAARIGVDTLRAIALGERPGAIAQLASGIAAQGYVAAHSREQEEEADRYGLFYLAGAGYDPNAMVSFFRKLDRLQGSEPDLVSRFFASHPSTPERIQLLEGTIREQRLRGKATAQVGGFEQIQARLRR